MHRFTSEENNSPLRKPILTKQSNAVMLEDGLVYVGEWMNGEKNGAGVLIYPNGSVLEGYQFQQQGIGLMEKLMDYVDQHIVLKNSNEISYFSYYGNIVNNRFQGYGEYETKESIYKGDWDNNEKHGYGEEYYKHGSIYCGSYKHGVKHGQGVLLLRNGSKYQIHLNRYSGSFTHNAMDGKGVIYWNDGSYYSGQFRDNQIDGYGVYTWPDGSCYNGSVLFVMIQFCKGMRHGHGWLTVYDGFELYGEWENGKFIKN